MKEQEEVAECYGVDVSTVYRLARQKKRTGSVKLRKTTDIALSAAIWS